MILSGELTKKYQSQYSDNHIWEDQISFGEIKREYNGESWRQYRGITIEHKNPINQYTDWQVNYSGIFMGIESFDYLKQGNDIRFDRSVLMGTGMEMVITNSPLYKYPSATRPYYSSTIDIYPTTPLATSTDSEPSISLYINSYSNTRNINISTSGGNTSSRTAIWGTLEINDSPFVNSDLNLKNSINNLIDEYDILFNNLIPRTYKFNDGASNRNHIGFIAQEVLEGLENANMDYNLCGIIGKLDANTDKEHWALRYEEFIALNTWQIQKLKTRVTELENEIKEIKKHYEI